MKNGVAPRVYTALFGLSVVLFIVGASQLTNFRPFFAKAFGRAVAYSAVRDQKLGIRAFPGEPVEWNVIAANSLNSQWASSSGLTLILMNPNTGFERTDTVAPRQQSWSDQIPRVDTSASPTRPVVLSGTLKVPDDLDAQTLQGRLTGSISYPVPALPLPSFLTTNRSVTIFEDLAVPVEMEIIPFNRQAVSRFVCALFGLAGLLICGGVLLRIVILNNLARWRAAAAERAIITFVRIVAPLAHPNQRVHLQIAAENHAPALHTETPEAALEGANLAKLRQSGFLHSWVQSNQGNWNHTDWQLLLDRLQCSEFWPLSASEVGSVLEELKRERDEDSERWFIPGHSRATGARFVYPAAP